MEQLSASHQTLKRLVGEQEVSRIMAETLEEL
jgi:hypothetical protein